MGSFDTVVLIRCSLFSVKQENDMLYMLNNGNFKDVWISRLKRKTSSTKPIYLITGKYLRLGYYYLSIIKKRCPKIVFL